MEHIQAICVNQHLTFMRRSPVDCTYALAALLPTSRFPMGIKGGRDLNIITVRPWKQLNSRPQSMFLSFPLSQRIITLFNALWFRAIETAMSIRD